ncbi:hypothetical protein EDB81DRAFT_773409 [Dactylonectria macrodidyma]|uniref:Secreted protein n=1 Tax=Dactylonectria macrodidyma TaxID=307937 RepID=A0A9P9FUX5_9HYPO|nr:hypothetical protein EDB81DRAFT_773409 [Dactylonectria macrodidyma]
MFFPVVSVTVWIMVAFEPKVLSSLPSASSTWHITADWACTRSGLGKKVPPRCSQRRTEDISFVSCVSVSRGRG